MNESAPGSAELAAAWARLRGVPAANVVRLSIPPATNGAPPVAITKEDFVAQVWEPANARLAAAGKRQAARFTWEETARRTAAAYREVAG